MNCPLTNQFLDKPVYKSNGDSSITSLCEILKTSTTVFLSANCGHIVTEPISNIDEYYNSDYKILIESEEEDQLYKIVNGETKFRFDHQANTFINKINPSLGAKILDYGCAKSTTLKKIVEKRKDIVPHLFDVSEMYINFWKGFVLPQNWCTHHLKDNWTNEFDVVTSFFALEHVANPLDMLQRIHQVLKPEGVFYFIVPNVFANTADFIVVDHVNHFSETSIKYLLSKANFELIEVDDTSHDSAYIVTCKKVEKSNLYTPIEGELEYIKSKVKEMTIYWSNISTKINEFERQLKPTDNIAIYGSGFYGTYITSCLMSINKVKCFIDSNPFKQGKSILNIPIVLPKDINKNIEALFVGLNPAIARKTIEEMKFFFDTNLKICYL